MEIRVEIQVIKTSKLVPHYKRCHAYGHTKILYQGANMYHIIYKVQYTKACIIKTKCVHCRTCELSKKYSFKRHAKNEKLINQGILLCNQPNQQAQQVRINIPKEQQFDEIQPQKKQTNL